MSKLQRPRVNLTAVFPQILNQINHESCLIFYCKNIHNTKKDRKQNTGRQSAIKNKCIAYGNFSNTKLRKFYQLLVLSAQQPKTYLGKKKSRNILVSFFFSIICYSFN